MKIDDISAPSGAHVPPMFQLYSDKGELHGIFALRRKDGDIIRIRFESAIRDGRYLAEWTHWENGPRRGIAAQSHYRCDVSHT